MESPAPQPPRPECRRAHGRVIRAYYFFFYAVLGSYMPFLNLYFDRTLGFSRSQIGAVFSMRSLMFALSPPVWGMIGDRFRIARALLAAGLGVSMLALLSFAAVTQFWQALLAMVVFASFSGPLFPLIDSIAFGYVARVRDSYGRMRIWGSAGFIGMGLLLYALFRSHSNLRLAFFAGAGACLLSLLLLPGLPSIRVRSRGIVGKRAIALYLRRDLLVFTLCGFLGNLAMMSYYTFFSNYLNVLHFDQRWIGLMWALGAVAEFPVVFFVDSLVRVLGIKTLYAVGLFGVVLRLFVLSLAPPPAIILLSQGLHALSFGAMYVGGLTYVNRRSPDDLRASAQSIYSATMLGAGGVTGSLAAGWFADHFGILAMFTIHAGIAAAGLAAFLLLFRESAASEAV